MAIDLELLHLIEARFDALRKADAEAIRLRHNDLSVRMAGFPEEFARKGEMVEASRSLQKLERESVSREVYDSAQRTIDEALSRLDRDKLSEAVFDTFIQTYRIEQERADEARRTLAATLAAGTETVRRQVQEERGNYVTEEHYSERHESVLRQVGAVERWQYKLVGGLVFATFVAPLLSAVLVYYFTRQVP